MNLRFYTKKVTVFTLLLLTAAISVFPQNAGIKPPRQEKLLNGLKVLMWSDPTAPNISVKIRFHSGSAFDPQAKEGLMQILAGNIFPNDAVKDFFAEDLGGSLEVTTNYDYIQINATSKTDEFLTLFETIANAVANVQIDKETTAKLKQKQLEKVSALEKNPVYQADQAAANRLLGSFPYGRTADGTSESVKKIDFADLIFARDRFLTADNATVTITGNFKTDLAFRAARRYFGAWKKADKLTPSTFRQPDEPDTKPFGVKMSSAGDSEVRYALRGLARNDKDYAASKILTKILNNRLQEFGAKDAAVKPFVRQSENILPGMIIFGYTAKNASNAAMPTDNKTLVDSPPNVATLLLSKSVSQEEYSKARAEVLTEISRKNYADWWLDVDTYKIASVSAEANSFDTVTQADVQRVAERLYKNPVVSVSLMPTGETAPKN